ncbi:unnamed protein product [Prunus armeniaca]
MVLGKNYVWLDPFVRVEIFGKCSMYKGNSAEISAESLVPLLLLEKVVTVLVSGPDIGMMSGIPQDSSQRSKVCKVASDLIDSALLCDEGFELLEKSFEDIRGKLTRLVSSRAHVEEPNGDVGTSYPQLRIKDPHRVKVKGRAKRVKEEKENAVQRHKRWCTECRKTDHDRRSCPKLASLSSSSNTEWWSSWWMSRMSSGALAFSEPEVLV